jgi:hypothetical protein
MTDEAMSPLMRGTSGSSRGGAGQSHGDYATRTNVRAG